MVFCRHVDANRAHSRTGETFSWRDQSMPAKKAAPEPIVDPRLETDEFLCERTPISFAQKEHLAETGVLGFKFRFPARYCSK
jgi:hypothetical protein